MFLISTFTYYISDLKKAMSKEKKGKKETKEVLESYRDNINSTCTNNRQVPIPQANNFRCLGYLQNI